MPDVSSALRAIIADDEPLARQALRRFVGADGLVDVVAEAEDLPSLKAVLQSVQADILFLDITMPGGSGLEAVPLLPSHVSLVFTTAHAEFAATAFELDAVDYLVKPFGQDRVREALARVQRARRQRDADASQPVRVLLVRTGTRLEPVPVERVWRFEGSDDFVRVITAGRQWLHGVTLTALEAQLDPAHFLRIHRSHIVNLSHISRLVARDARRLAAEFADGSRVVCSRAGSTLLRQRARILDR